MTRKIEETIEKFLSKQENNKDGVVYNTVNVEDRELVKDVLTRFYPAFESLFQSKDDAEQIFIERLMYLKAIRFDNKDENLYPFKDMFDSVRKQDNGKLTGGVTYTCDEGVFMADMDYMNLSLDEAKHTLIHELAHLFATIILHNKEQKTILKTGLRICSEDEFMVFLNEGFTELIAQILWAKMYPDVKCPGIGRQNYSVKSSPKE